MYKILHKDFLVQSKYNKNHVYIDKKSKLFKLVKNGQISGVYIQEDQQQ